MNIDIEHWITSEKTILKSKKFYSHFDYRTSISKCRDYIMDPHNIATHGFYPFIHYEKKMIKYNKTDGKKEKVRDICYASHIDSCIYQLYSFILNEYYNAKVQELGISSVAVAYRTDLHESNIQFAKRAIDFIRQSRQCYVMIGDFTGFFDNLDHRYLKERWCDLIGEKSLPNDHYAVFKNITKFSRWELTDLLELNGLEDTPKGRRKLNSLPRVLTAENFRNNRSHIVQNKECGIPQGSPISATLANVYMIDIDEKINNVVSSTGGLYMRYSDDFIVVIPQVSDGSREKLKEIVSLFKKTPGITLEPNKTQYFEYHDSALENCGKIFDIDADCRKKVINFLGFTFDGKKVVLRAKAITKYYYRMYSKAKTIANGRTYSRFGRRVSCANLYKRYSHRGAYCKQGNFLTYVNRSKRCFGSGEAIDRDTKRHMQKIRNALKSGG